MRRRWQMDYSPIEFFLAVLCAKICGFGNLGEYQDYGKIKLKFLCTFLPHKDSLLSKSIIFRVLALTCPEKLENTFSWQRNKF